MKKNILFMLIVFLITGCGTESQNRAQEKDHSNGGEEQLNQNEVVSELTKKDPLVYEYQVKNESEREIEFSFSSSQRYDFSISTKEGERVYLYSSTASFLQVLGDEKIEAGEQLVYTIDCNRIDLSEGEYILTVWLTPTEGKKYKASQEFSI